jgi:hypothetical protein
MKNTKLNNHQTMHIFSDPARNDVRIKLGLRSVFKWRTLRRADFPILLFFFNLVLLMLIANRKCHIQDMKGKVTSFCVYILTKINITTRGITDTPRIGSLPSSGHSCLVHPPTSKAQKSKLNEKSFHLSKSCPTN